MSHRLRRDRDRHLDYYPPYHPRRRHRPEHYSPPPRRNNRNITLPPPYQPPVLINLIREKCWNDVQTRATEHPSEATPTWTTPTALSLCCQKGAPLEVIQTVVSACKKQLRVLGRGSGVGGCPLHEAIGLGLSLEIVEYLIEADGEMFLGDDAEEGEGSRAGGGGGGGGFHLQSAARKRDAEGRTPLHRWVDRILTHQPPQIGTNVMDLTSSARRHDDDEVDGCGAMMRVTRKLIDACPEATAMADKNGRTPLMMVLKWEPPPNTEQGRFNQVERRIFDVTKIMVEAHAPALKVTCSSFGCNPLHYAVIHKRKIETLEMLLESWTEATLVTNNIGELPLHIAAMMAASIDVLTLILRAGPKAAIAQDRGGRTPLHWAWIRHVSSRNMPRPINVSSTARRNVPSNWIELQDAALRDIASNHSFPHQQHLPSPSASHQHFVQFWDTALLLLRTAYPHQPFYPVHAATSVSCPRAILQISLLLHPRQTKLRDRQGQLPLHIATAQPLSSSWKLDELSSLPTPIDMLLHTYPHAARVCDVEKRLPLHVMISSQRKTSRKHFSLYIHQVRKIMSACPEALGRRDGWGLFPFMLAAAQGSLNVSYQLLREGPEMVSFGILEGRQSGSLIVEEVERPMEKRLRIK